MLFNFSWLSNSHGFISSQAKALHPSRTSANIWVPSHPNSHQVLTPSHCHGMLVPKCSEHFGGCRGMVSHGDLPWPLNKQLNSVVLKKSDKNKAQSYSHVAKNRSGMWCLPAMHSRSCKGTSWHFGESYYL